MKKISLVLVIVFTSFLALGQSKRMSKLIESGKMKFELNDYHGAIKDFNKVIEIDENNVFAFYERGRAKDKLGDFYGSVDDFTKALEIDNKYTQAYIERGNVKNEKLNYKGAITDYTKALTLKPENEPLLLKLGQTQMALLSYKESIESFTHLISLDPENRDAYYLRGLIYIHLHHKIKGCQDLSKAGELGDHKAYEMLNEYCK